MAKRFTIGLNYFFDNQSNSGIVNYIYNIIAALNILPKDEKPAIVVFYSANAPVDYLKTIQYPFITYRLFHPYPLNFFLRKVNGLARRIIKKDIYREVKYYSKIDTLYPCFTINDINFDDYKNRVFWLVDFNNRAFPDHYDDKGSNMLKQQQELTSSDKRVVLSSNALFNELKGYYPNYKCDIKLMRFASSLPELNEQDIPAVKKNHHIDVPYLMSPNQLWEHKNQGMVLDALNIIRQKQPDLKFKVLFSGSIKVNRGKGLYIDTLRNKVEEYGLRDYIEFLGVLDRKDQLLLMKGSHALLQPSLYEGWSTLVEEAKALNKFIILSALPVHKEQISENVDFFDPHNAQQLADKIIACLKHSPVISPLNYQENIYNYAKDILNALTINV
ncbi:glycosyltransferase [Mucilaginibacter segetis]|uniref:Glycosyltransferase n=1 Tax=Mucilaginibacter segetis TaxID=2793071 RepID=A0A934PX12_9SPHI|nr:glycosyltransferase [Mucilaginibacter segetis]MBK0380651.1 glycosyltransferase [Mucilaginibacter segetis]